MILLAHAVMRRKHVTVELKQLAKSDAWNPRKWTGVTAILRKCFRYCYIIIIINRHFKDAQLTKVVTKAPAVTTIQDDKQSTS